MKRILAIILALTLCLTLLPAVTPVNAVSLDDLEYIINNGEVTIIGCYYNASGELIIPDTIEGYPVTSIGEEAFDSCKKITSITIPASVTSIGPNAFSYTTSLAGIWVSEDNTAYCNDSYGVLFNKDKSELVKAPDMLSGDYVIPDGVFIIKEQAFIRCEKMTAVSIPETVAVIAECGFLGCESLTSVTVPGSVAILGELAFSQCFDLTSVTLSNGITDIPNFMFAYCDSLTDVTIADTVTSVGEYAFYQCFSLSSLTLPNGVTSIGSNAFADCTSLSDINIPDSVARIGGETFAGCSSLAEITIPDSVTNIGYYAFLGCSSLVEITIPGSVRELSEHMFAGCTNLSNVTISNGVTRIGEGVFSDCSSLTSITIPESVTYIEHNGYVSFFGESIKAIWVSEKNAVYSSDNCGVLFNKNKSKLIAAPGGISGAYTVPDGVTDIGERAFYNCTNLTSLTIADSVEAIEQYAFFNCSGLASATISEGVTSIDDYAFYDCNKLKNVYFCGDVPDFGYSVFNSYGTAYCHPGASGWSQSVLQNAGGYFVLKEDHFYESGACIVCGEWEGGVAPAPVVSGSVTAVGEGDVTLTLYAAGEDAPVKSLTVSGSGYSLEGVAAGEYTMTVAKEGCVTRSYSVVIGTEDLTLNLKLHQLGDVNGDGRVNVGDVVKIYSHTRNGSLSEDAYGLLCADYNGDGRVNVGDTVRVYALVKG